MKDGIHGIMICGSQTSMASETSVIVWTTG